ncbi:hypothetical protein I317_04621 [Kwoniella heveanensis CBS 569]|nr:hypothetical protein I317_04621 [Kwoniella heveanensis CBS 569]
MSSLSIPAPKPHFPAEIDKHLAEYTIKIASEEQKKAHFEACWEMPNWPGQLNRENRTNGRWMVKQFAKFFESHYKGDWSKDRGPLHWALVRRDDPEGEPYSFIVTLRRRCFIKQQQHDIKRGWYYAITEVITPLRHRRKGYATHLCRLLHYVLASPRPELDCPSLSGVTITTSSKQLGPFTQSDPSSIALPPFPAKWGAPPAAIPNELAGHIPQANGSLLWSDIDIAFYGRCTVGLDQPGWCSAPEENYKLVWALRPVNLESDNQTASDFDRNINATWEPIHSDTLPGVRRLLSRAVQSKLRKCQPGSGGVYTADPASPGALNYIDDKGRSVPPPDWLDESKVIPYGFRLRRSVKHDVAQALSDDCHSQSVKEAERNHKGEDEVGEVDVDGDYDGNDDAIVMVALRNYQVGPRLLITYIHNLHPEDLSSLLVTLDRLVTEHNAPCSEAECWSLNPDVRDDAQLIQRWKELEERDAKVEIRQGLRSHVLGYCWYGDEGVASWNEEGKETRIKMADTQLWNWV